VTIVHLQDLTDLNAFRLPQIDRAEIRTGLDFDQTFTVPDLPFDGPTGFTIRGDSAIQMFAPGATAFSVLMVGDGLGLDGTTITGGTTGFLSTGGLVIADATVAGPALSRLLDTPSARDDRAFLAGLLTGDDFIFTDTTNRRAVTAFGAAGDDILSGGRGADELDGGAGRDIIVGFNGDDILTGGAGTDSLYGSDGDDIIAGGGGGDLLTGDNGLDLFAYARISDSRAGGATDLIADFTPGEDALILSDIDFNRGQDGRQALVFGETTPTAHGVWTVQRGDILHLRADVTGDARADMVIRLFGITGLTADDLL
jgi:Ca2+-binding RTX toxin-like protein